ncbi:cytochrome P450 monooxygenase [Rhodofomes roseus]|uniref:Cytochrome P450 monooxygenase n=1 Tax=Rhodofomes roseus TaxID=34475 RepID=A0ABQ8KE87_9APHY|nr:cytochrome P450 monooxygenase [Rhodofomes roseus]KAH9836047.1 cytochrome P450 monooxygenase [Rhodofomes roseus]
MAIIELLLVLIVIFFICTTRDRRSSLPPGPSRLPIVGSAHHLPLKYQQHVFKEWRKIYGALRTSANWCDVVYLRIFNKPAIILNSARAMEELLDRRGYKYSDRPRTIYISELVGLTNNVTILPYGDQWRRQRRWFQTAFQTSTALDSYIPLQRRESVRLLAGLIDANQDGNDGDWVGIFLFKGLKHYVSALMMDIAYGHSVSCPDDEFVALAERAILGIIEAGGAAASLIDFFPFLKFIPAWIPGMHFMAKVAEVNRLNRQMIDVPYERVHAAMVQGTARDCFMTTLLDEYTIDGQVSDYDREDIKGAANIVYGAGTDTTATALTTFMLAIVLYPNTRQRAQNELDAVVGTERLPEFEDRASLPYLEALLKEVFRWNPPVPLALPHQLTEDDTYDSYTIPAGSMIMPNVWYALFRLLSYSKAEPRIDLSRCRAITRDPEYYEEPDVFKPERFLSANPERDPRDFVFGFGRRLCPGQAFGDSSIWLAVSRILATLDVTKARDPTTGVEIDFEPEFISGMMSHVIPFPCGVRPRSDKSVELIRALEAEEST